jgi:Flp pilus assembly pilin Flp
MTPSRNERGQTTAEYVAVTAFALAIAMGVVFSVLSGTLTSSVEEIGTAISQLVTDALP